MANQTVCDNCGSVIRGRLIIPEPGTDNKETFCSIVIRGKTINNGSWKTIDICFDCMQKAVWEDFEFPGPHKYTPVKGGKRE
jgi:hypothetical protein